MTEIRLITILEFVLGAVLGFLSIWGLTRWAHKMHLLDLPDERKHHKVPVPRLGGLCIFPLLSLTVPIGMGFTGDWQRSFLSLWGAAFILCLLGIREDLYRVSPKGKFRFQILATLIFLTGGVYLMYPDHIFGISTLGWFGYIATAAIVLHIVNAVNLIDGIDGLSAELCICSLLVSGTVEYLEGNAAFAILAVATVGILVAFLSFNLPEKVFMGDTGCWTLGLVIVFLGRHSGQCGHPRTGLLVTLAPLLIPLMDMARVALFRVTHGISVVHPDNNHIHHLLMRKGLSQRQTRLLLVGITLFHTALNYWLCQWVPTGWILVAEVALIVCGAILLNSRIPPPEKKLQ